MDDQNSSDSRVFPEQGDPMQDPQQPPDPASQSPQQPATAQQAAGSGAGDPARELNVLRSQLQTLEQRIASMERRQSQFPALPDTNLLSGSFLTRAFAVLGHYMVATLIIMVPLYILIFVIILAVGIGLSGM
jgi:hypothetical protein